MSWRFRLQLRVRRNRCSGNLWEFLNSIMNDMFMTRHRRTVFLTNECQTLEGVGNSRNRQSKAHSFCFSQKLKPTSVVWESKRQVASPNTPFRFALAGTNTIGIVCALRKKNREKGSFSCCLFCRTKPSLSALLPFPYHSRLLAAVKMAICVMLQMIRNI